MLGGLSYYVQHGNAGKAVKLVEKEVRRIARYGYYFRSGEGEFLTSSFILGRGESILFPVI